MFRIGHLSDLHLGPVPGLRLRDYLSKRLVGYANWRRSRARLAASGSLARLVEDLRAQQPDHIVVTGDLTNLAMREEYQNARAWLEKLGPPERVTAIPGNHDAYVPGAYHRYRRQWAPWMASDDAERDDMVGDDVEFVGEALFPFMRRKRYVALIGVSSAVATAPFMATGRVGRSQTERLGRLLDEARAEGLFRVILIHHPPKLVDPRRAWRKLTDGRRFRRAVERHGAELILHGHEHIRAMTAIRGRNGIAVPVVGVPAGGATVKGGPRAAGYALHEIAENGGGYELTVIHRGVGPSGEIVETARTSFSVRA